MLSSLTVRVAYRPSHSQALIVAPSVSSVSRKFCSAAKRIAQGSRGQRRVRVHQLICNRKHRLELGACLHQQLHSGPALQH